MLRTGECQFKMQISLILSFESQAISLVISLPKLKDKNHNANVELSYF